MSQDICPQDSPSRASPATVIVVEDSEVFRRFICSSLRNKPDLQIICEASDGREGVQKCEELQPDLVILDIGLPTLNGIEAARRIRQLSPRSRILFLSQETSPDVIEAALGTGALGFVGKSSAAVELISAVEAVLRNEQLIRIA